LEAEKIAVSYIPMMGSSNYSKGQIYINNSYGNKQVSHNGATITQMQTTQLIYNISPTYNKT
jgi:hypothetical protein